MSEEDVYCYKGDMIPVSEMLKVKHDSVTMKNRSAESPFRPYGHVYLPLKSEVIKMGSKKQQMVGKEALFICGKWENTLDYIRGNGKFKVFSEVTLSLFVTRWSPSPTSSSFYLIQIGPRLSMWYPGNKTGLIMEWPMEQTITLNWLYLTLLKLRPFFKN